VYENTGSIVDAVEVSGAEINTATAVAAAGDASETPVRVTVVDTAVPTVAVEVAAPSVITSAELAAFDGTTATRLRPNAATATSAMRLKVVFVDICFLSISRFSDDPRAGCG
jgi:hypothetical protein